MKRPYFELQPCLCGCGRYCGWHSFKRGHSTTALAQVVHDHYQGSARRFILACGAEPPAGHPWPAASKAARKWFGSLAGAVLAHRN